MKQIYAKSIIDKKLKNNIFIDLDFEDDDAYINIFFNSIDSYNKFISEPTIYKNYFSAAARNLYKELVDEICNNTSKANFKFIRIIKKSNTHIRLYSLNDLDNIIKSNIPCVIDIWELSFKDKVKLLTENDLSNYYFYDKYNEFGITDYKRLKEMYEILLVITENVVKNNYSELEKVFYMYNLLKTKIYKKAKDDDDYKSRSLVDVISSDEIVCAGFVNYFNALCDILGIRAQRVHWLDINEKEEEKDKKTGHASSIVYINDNKYNIVGIFPLDITWDSKKSQRDQTYRMNLKHCLLSCDMDDEEKEVKGYVNQNYDNYHELNSLYEKYRYFGYRSLKLDIIDCINEIYYLLNVDYMVDEFCDIEKEIEIIDELANRDIPLSILRNVINTVDPTLEQDGILDFALTTNYHYNDKENEVERIRNLF